MDLADEALLRNIDRVSLPSTFHGKDAQDDGDGDAVTVYQTDNLVDALLLVFVCSRERREDGAGAAGRMWSVHTR